MKKKHIKMKEVLNEGLIQNIIASILKGIYSGKTSDIISRVEPVNAELAKDLEKLRKNVDDLNKKVSDPEMIELFKKYGIDISNWPKLNR